MKIAVINDLSGMGRCSLTASIPILNTLGHTVYPVPTAVLSNQTGYDKYTFFDFTPHLKEYVGVWKDMGVKFDCVYSGFLSNAEQGEIILDLYENCGAPGARLVIDPVMGDDGVMYDTFDDRLCDEVKKLAATADIITPNLTEACMLAGVGYDEFIGGLTEENFYDAHYALAEKCAAVCKGGRAVITGVTRNEGLRRRVFYQKQDVRRALFGHGRHHGVDNNGLPDVGQKTVGKRRYGRRFR